MKNIILSFLLFFSFILADEKSRFFGAAVEGFPNIESIYKLEYEFGFVPDLVQFYIGFDKKNKNLIKDFSNSLNTLKSFSIIPIITLEPMYIKNDQENIIDYLDILDHKYDDFLLNITNEIKKHNFPIIIRFAQEMNLSRYHWGLTSLKEYDEKASEIYKKMYRYVYFFFKKENVENTLFAFCPNVESIPNEDFNNLINYYPGNDVVDLLGLDGYNFNKCANKKNMGWKSSYRSFKDIFSNSIETLKNLDNKPIIIFETSSAMKGGQRDKWIKEALYDFSKMNLTALIWFQIDKECSWKINSKTEKEIIINFFDINKNLVNKYFKEFIDEKNKVN
jgi:beta-mannanase